MEKSENLHPGELAQVIAQMKDLESRLYHLEARLDQISHQTTKDLSVIQPVSIESDDQARTGRHFEGNYESTVVENGFAWLSAIVYLFGIIFLMAYIRNTGLHLLSSLLGYTGAAFLFIVPYFLKKSFPHLISVGRITGLLLLYYVTLKLHFFTEVALVNNKVFALGLLLVVIGIQVYVAIKRENQFLASLAMILIALSALLYDGTYITLTLLAGLSLVSLILFIRQGWWRLLMLVMFTVYIAHMLWYLNNPIMGHPLQAVDSHYNNIYFLFLYATIFALTLSFHAKNTISDNILISIAIFNALLFTFLILFVVLKFYGESYTGIFMALTGLCLIYSVYLKATTDRKFAPAFYACFGFMALSVSVYGFSGLPEVYFYLAIQSLLVVSMALWFRSRIIVIVNTLLFIFLLLLYLFSADPLHHISFTFAIVALLTARVMNWQKERLSLKTDLIRNIYLGIAFITFLVAIYNAVPSQYITISWTAFAVFYFVLSILLSNVKYRWMAIATLLVSSGRLFLVDLASLETGYRVLAFLIYAVIVFSISIYYTKKIKKQIE